MRPIERLAQNLYISPPYLSQVAALAAFDASEELEAVKAGYARKPRASPGGTAAHRHRRHASRRRRLLHLCRHRPLHERFDRPSANACSRRRASRRRPGSTSTRSRARTTCASPSPGRRRIAARRCGGCGLGCGLSARLSRHAGRDRRAGLRRRLGPAAVQDAAEHRSSPATTSRARFGTALGSGGREHDPRHGSRSFGHQLRRQLFGRSGAPAGSGRVVRAPARAGRLGFGGASRPAPARLAGSGSKRGGASTAPRPRRWRPGARSAGGGSPSDRHGLAMRGALSAPELSSRGSRPALVRGRRGGPPATAAGPVVLDARRRPPRRPRARAPSSAAASRVVLALVLAVRLVGSGGFGGCSPSRSPRPRRRRRRRRRRPPPAASSPSSVAVAGSRRRARPSATAPRRRPRSPARPPARPPSTIFGRRDGVDLDAAAPPPCARACRAGSPRVDGVGRGAGERLVGDDGDLHAEARLELAQVHALLVEDVERRLHPRAHDRGCATRS